MANIEYVCATLRRKKIKVKNNIKKWKINNKKLGCTICVGG